jgi:Mce-associated membrane protein
MPTTRHHINGRRRRQAREAQRAQAPEAPAPVDGARTGQAPLPPRTAPETPAGRPETTDEKERPDADAPPQPQRAARRPRPWLPALLCLLTLALGGFAGWAHARAGDLRDDPAARNTALTDVARTSEIKGRTAKAVAEIFSYDHADPGAFDRAANEWLTGRAVAQHRTLLGDLRTRADQQKAVITTTVTDSAVERIDGNRARVLVYADQSSVSTAGGGTGATRGEERGQEERADEEGRAKQKQKQKQTADQGTYAGAMFAVDLAVRDGRWLVSGIDTFGR